MTQPVSTSGRETSAGPGTRLAQARQDLRLELEEVARRLHLSTRQVEALERDDYSSLPGSTYVRGYLKSYATLLGIDPAPVLDAHSKLTAKPTPPPDFSNIAPQRQMTSRHHQVRIVTYLVAVIVIGLAIAWWQGRNTPPASPVAAIQNTDPAIPGASTDSPDTLTAAPGVSPEGTTVGGTVTAPVVPVPTPPATGKPVAPAAPVAQPPASPIPAATKPAASAVTPSPPHPGMEAVPVAPAAPLPAGPRGKVVVHAEQDTWLDVRDARQVKLIYETVTAGRTVTLEGIVPLSIFLGNAAGARVEYNGQAVDVARHKRGMVARFVVGEEDATLATPR